MTQYIAFLRGINISGKNTVPMAALKTAWEEAGFREVSTYLNSGNIRFSSEVESVDTIKATAEAILLSRFGLTIPVYILRRAELTDLLSHAPDWWGTDDPDAYDNLIFILTGDSPADICRLAGAPSEGLERIEVWGKYIFWTFNRKNYTRCRWW